MNGYGVATIKEVGHLGSQFNGELHWIIPDCVGDVFSQVLSDEEVPIEVRKAIIEDMKQHLTNQSRDRIDL